MQMAMKGLRLHLLALGALLATTAGCAVEREPNMEFAPWINHMMFSSAAESYAPSPVSAKTGKPVFANGRVNQLPPLGTIPRDFAPVYSLWRWERNAMTGDSSQSLLWNLYRRERHKADTRSVGVHGAGGSWNRQTSGLPHKYPSEQLDVCKKISFLFGLIQYKSDLEGRWWRVCYFPIGRTCADAPASTH